MIQHRKSLPVFLGNGWRCYACAFECSDFLAMADHIVVTHEPAPFNEEDYAEHWSCQVN